MDLKIRQELVGETKKIIVNVAKNELQIYENSNQWNSQGINKFLINLACILPQNEIIELVYDTNNDEVDFKHVISLFECFVKEYNLSIKKE